MKTGHPSAVGTQLVGGGANSTRAFRNCFRAFNAGLSNLLALKGSRRVDPCKRLYMESLTVVLICPPSSVL